LKCIIFSIDRFLKNQRVFNVLWGFQQSPETIKNTRSWFRYDSKKDRIYLNK
jgi:hypothetical protein